MISTPTQLLQQARDKLGAIVCAEDEDNLRLNDVDTLIELAIELLASRTHDTVTVSIDNIPVAFRSFAEVMAACDADQTSNPKHSKE